MLTPKQLDHIPDNMVELYSQVEADIIADMARRISGFNMFIPSAEWQFQKLQEMGLMYNDIVKRLAQVTGKTQKEIKQLIEDAGAATLKADDAIYRKAGLNPSPLSASPTLQKVLQAGIEKTNGLFENLTRTTANTATRQFERALDRAYMQITTGAFDYNSAIRMAIKDLAKKGIASIEYPSGHVDYMDVAVRRAVLTGVNQTALKMQDARADEMGCDLVETTAHSGARPDHAVWQGKIFSRSGKHPKYPDFISSTGYGTGPGLGGWNCRHSYFVYIEGVSEPAYTQAELEDMNAKKYEYNGEKLTEYEASQKQRTIERNIRKWKREAMGLEAAGIPADEALSKVSQWNAVQNDFITKTGLKRQAERENMIGFGAAQSRKAVTIDNKDISNMKAVLGNDKMPNSIAFYKKMKYTKDESYKLLRDEYIEKVLQYDFDNIPKNSLNNVEARKWYDAKDKNIPNLIDKSKSVEEQALQAHTLRNQYRTQTRDLMKNQKTRKELDNDRPNETFEETVARKMRDKHFTRQQALEDVIKTAATPNKKVNQKLGLE